MDLPKLTSLTHEFMDALNELTLLEDSEEYTELLEKKEQIEQEIQVYSNNFKQKTERLKEIKQKMIKIFEDNKSDQYTIDVNGGSIQYKRTSRAKPITKSFIRDKLEEISKDINIDPIDMYQKLTDTPRVEESKIDFKVNTKRT